MTNSFDHIVKIRIQMGPNFISHESVKNAVKNYVEIDKRKPFVTYSKTAKRHEAQFVPHGPIP